MKSNEDKRLRRAGRIRRRIHEFGSERLTIHRTPNHIYAQIFDKDGTRVLASASTLEKEVRAQIKHGGNVEAAKLVGRRIAEKARTAGITAVAFDRAGYQYHGRVKALADAAREGGLQF
jgi:large subunit ribosomal protein L18